MASKPSKHSKELRDDLSVCVDVALVRRAIEFASIHDVRYYLNGVCIQPSKSGGVLVMASDGHMALTLHDPHGKADKPYIVPFNKAKHPKALSEKGAAYVTVSPTGQITVTDAFYQTLFIHPGKLIDGMFPDLTAAFGSLDDYEIGLKGAFNPDYLKRAIDSTGRRGKFEGVCFYSRKKNGASSSSLFTTPGGFGLLMPMRAEPELGKNITKDFGGFI